ncbi:MAG: hypothetical protein H0X30_13800 [Anaerolineae bacterium]|nr:hypothetical protein [Anaerolineae bacterium]
MGYWIAIGALFGLIQLCCYAWFTPERHPQPIPFTRFDKWFAWFFYGIAYILSLLRLPFAILPYCIKLLRFLLFKQHYQVSDYLVLVEGLRIVGDVANWLLGIILVEHLGIISPMIKWVLYVSIAAEGIRLFAEKGQMILSALWQLLPHRLIANWLNRKVAWPVPIRRYCQYYRLNDEDRIEYILSALRAYAAVNPDTSAKLAYLSTLRLTHPTHGMRGGHVRDVARGEVFIHPSWTSDPWLLIGQALRRVPWVFDPRYLRRPFYYRSESNRLATLFVLSNFRFCPTYAIYQFGHEIKAARYDCFYRVLRRFKLDIEPQIQADGTFPFDQFFGYIERKMGKVQSVVSNHLWSDEDVIADVRRRQSGGEQLSTLDIAGQYTYPLKYVEEILIFRL